MVREVYLPTFYFRIAYHTGKEIRVAYSKFSCEEKVGGFIEDEGGPATTRSC